jgi:hypothetical protein
MAAASSRREPSMKCSAIKRPAFPSWSRLFRRSTMESAIGWMNPDSPGGASQNSSLGLAGWAPLIDRSRNLQVLVGMQNAIRPFQPYYPLFKTILRNLISPATLTPSGVTNAASYEAGPIAPGELLASPPSLNIHIYIYSQKSAPNDPSVACLLLCRARPHQRASLPAPRGIVSS